MNRMMVITGVLATFLLSSLTVFAQTQSRAGQQKQTDNKLTEVEKKSLEPSQEARAKYAEFLKSRNTGLIVLLPREMFDPQATGRNRAFVGPGEAPETPVGGVRVKNRLPMQLNSTYLLRAVNYAHSDVLVAFRVVEIDSDGSPLILWKLLKRYSTPQLER